MNTLIIGSGKGSYTMRAVQMGAALGARVVQTPSEADVTWADVVVLVKRAGAAWAGLVHRYGKPVVWDALDFWAQPRDNGATPDASMALLKAQMKVIQPTLTIGATAAMARACHGAYLPHHSWHGLQPTPARDVVTTVGYEGNPAYLGRWAGAVKAACDQRGWTFVVNPTSLSACDILVAFRDGPWDGWICREWKSGVKVVNAIAAGRPLIAQSCAAVTELQPCGTVIESPSDLDAALDAWTPADVRGVAADYWIDAASHLTLGAVAQQYRDLLSEVGTCAA